MRSESPLILERHHVSMNGRIDQTLTITNDQIQMQEEVFTTRLWAYIAERIVNQFLSDEKSKEMGTIVIVDQDLQNHFKSGRFRKKFVQLSINHQLPIEDFNNLNVNLNALLKQTESQGSERFKRIYRRFTGSYSG